MRFPASRTAIIFAAAICCAPLALDAQLIRINNNGLGGVNIRAPFVRINTSPYGTRVRAPFVDVNSPPPAYYQPPYYAPAVPYYQPAPARPYYRVPSNSGVINGVPNASQAGPRFNPTRPGEQSQKLGTAPSVPPRNGQNVVPRSKTTTQAPSSLNFPSTTGKSNDGNAAQQKIVPASQSGKQGVLKSVLEKPEMPPVKQMEELPPPKPSKSTDPKQR